MFNKALIIGILLVGATFSISANAVQKWEYKCMEMERDSLISNAGHRGFKTEDYIAIRFNRLGEEGWEMVGYAMNNGTNVRIVCFKRKKS